MCYLYPGSKWFIGREELKRLMSSSYITFLKVCKHHEIPRDDWKLNGQYNYIEFKNGSRIDLLDLKYLPGDPLYERFGSLEYTGGWIEEGGEVDFGAFDTLKSRVGRHMNKEYGIPPKILITCNPKKNWLYSVVYKPHREHRLPRQYSFIQALYKDNPHTAEEYGEVLGEITDESKIQRLKYGNWEYDSDPAKLMSYDAICDLFTNKTPKSEEQYLTIDVARHGKDRAVIKRWKGWQVMEVQSYPKCDIDMLQEVARSLCDKHRIPRSRVIADEDGVGGGFVDNFKCKGFINNSSCIQPDDKTKRVNYASLKSQCYFLLAVKVNKRGIGIEKTEYEEYIKEELEQVKQKDLDKDRPLAIVGKDEVKKNLGRSPDFSDALMMRMWFDLQPPEEGTTYDDYEKSVDSLCESQTTRPKMGELGFTPEQMREQREYERSVMDMMSG